MLLATTLPAPRKAIIKAVRRSRISLGSNEASDITLKLWDVQRLPFVSRHHLMHLWACHGCLVNGSSSGNSEVLALITILASMK